MIQQDDSDFDPFLEFRPQRARQELPSTDDQKDSDLDPFAEFRPNEVEIAETKKAKAQKKQEKTAPVEIAKDVAKQFTKGALIGAGGAYGDLLDLTGLNKDPSEKQRIDKDIEILQRSQQPGYKENLADIMALGEDSDRQVPFYLPTSKDLSSLNEAIGGPGEAETTAGKYASRAGKLYGGGLAFGQVNPIPAVAAGSVGQTVEEMGGGPIAQVASEIATLILTQGRGAGKELVSASKKQVQDKINNLRKLGYTEQDITLAINAANKGGKAAKFASKSERTKQAFEDVVERSDQLVSDILSAEIPGIEHGTKYVHQMASDADGQVVEEASTLALKNVNPFVESANTVIKAVEKGFGSNEKAQELIKRLKQVSADTQQAPSTEILINFYKELNSMGSWMGRSQKDRLITQVKNGIKDTLKANGSKGEVLAEQFDKVNKGIQRAYQAEDLHGLIQKATTQDGIDYKKFNKVFDKADNVELMEKVLGESQTRNLKLISKTGKEIKDFDKAWNSTSQFTVENVLQKGGNLASMYHIFSGDWIGLAKVIGIKGGTAVAKRIAEKSLTDPKFQNITIRALYALSRSSPKSFKAATESMNKYLKDEGIDLE